MTGTVCIRGCAHRGEHHDGCANPDCAGCLGRETEHGLLCRGCIQHLTEWLSAAMPPDGWEELPANRRKELPNSLTWAVEAVNLAGERGVQGVAYDLDRVGVSNEIAAPVNLARLVLVKEIDETVKSWLEWWVSERGLRGIDGWNLAYGCRYLTSWLDEITCWEPVGDMWDELADLMIRAHAIAPWRRERRSCGGVPCPDCSKAALVVYGGDDVVTCEACGTMLHRGEYERWVKQVADESKPKPLSFWANDLGKSLRTLQRATEGLKPDATDRNGRKLYVRDTLDEVVDSERESANVAWRRNVRPKTARS